MTTALLFYLTITILLGLAVALFQYKPWLKSDKTYWILSILKALSIGALLLLLFNPKTNLNNSRIVKPKLCILLDNTQSVKFLNKDKTLDSVYKVLISNKILNKKFELQTYSFGKDLKASARLDFKAPQTNLGKSLQTLNEINKDERAAVVLISDGNQTIGSSYLYSSSRKPQAVYPIILGDTTEYIDLKIQRLNVNKYAFLGNIFPVEVFVNYNGNQSIQTELTVHSKGSLVFRKKIVLTAEKNSTSIAAYLKAESIGLQSYRVQIKPLKDEILTTNNRSDFGIEIVDQKIKIALISKSSHPDLGALKSILSNQKNYELVILDPDGFSKSPSDYNIAVLYQPTVGFESAIKAIDKYNINSFTIGGTHTDWNFLNSTQSNFRQEDSGQYEDFQAIVNPNFDGFALETIDFDNFPPLKTVFGTTQMLVPHRVLLYKSINNIKTKQPLLASYSKPKSRHIIMFAENLWKWRMHSYRQYKSFEKFDSYFVSVFQNLSTQKSSDRLQVNYESIFDGSTPIAIYAQFYGENFKFNPNAELEIEVKSVNLELPLKLPMLLENNTYKVNLENLKPGSYSFRVRLKNKQFSVAGRFKILPFNIEAQFTNADVDQLRLLAAQTKGKAYFDSEVGNLIKLLISNDNFKSLQKVEKKSVPLIHFKWLLMMLIISLASEWFLRKYNGLT